MAARIPALLALTAALTFAACNKAGAPRAAGDSTPPPATASATAIVACKLMPMSEINEITGMGYTKTDGQDDANSGESGCQYMTETDPAGTTLNVQWIKPGDYADPAEHLAMQKAVMGGTKLGGALVNQTTGGAGIKGIPSGPVDGVGEEARMTLLLLTARKGDYTVLVQMFPRDPMKLVTDSVYARSFYEFEKTIAIKTLAKL